MFFLIVFFAIVSLAEFLAGWILKYVCQSESENKSMSFRLWNACGVTFATMGVAFLLYGYDGVFELNAKASLPLLVFAAFAGSITTALTVQSSPKDDQPSLRQLNLAEVARETILGAMLRQLLIGVMVVLLFMTVFVAALLAGQVS